MIGQGKSDYWISSQNLSFIKNILLMIFVLLEYDGILRSIFMFIMSDMLYQLVNTFITFMFIITMFLLNFYIIGLDMEITNANNFDRTYYKLTILHIVYLIYNKFTLIK